MLVKESYIEIYSITQNKNFFEKYSFLGLWGVFKKAKKKYFDIPKFITLFHKNHSAVLQLSFREIFIFLNIPGNYLLGSF